MKADEILHRVVHSLSHSQRKQAESNLTPQMRELFDFLMKQPKYDRDATIRALGMTKTPKRLRNLKLRTLDRILLIISGITSGKDRLSEIGIKTAQIRALIDLGLISFAHKKALKALNIAEELELFEDQLKLLSTLGEIQSLRHKFDRNKDLKPANRDTAREYASVLEKFNQVGKGQMFYYEVLDFLRTPTEPAEKATILRKFWNRLPPYKECTSIRSKLLNLRIQYMLLRGKLEYEQSADCSSRIVHLLESQKGMLTDPTIHLIYAKHLYNQALLFVEQKKFSQARQTIRRMEVTVAQGREPSKPAHVIFHRVLLIRLLIARQQQNGSEVLDLLKEVEAEIQHIYAAETDPTIVAALLRLSTDCAIQIGELKLARTFLDQYLEESKTKMHPPMVVMGRIFELIIHYENRDFDLLEYAIRNVSRFFKKYRLLSPYTNVWLKMFKSLCAVPTKNPIAKHALKSAREQLQVLSRDRQYFEYCNSFDFRAWIDRHLKT